MNVAVVIMAGGAGTRFWPLSTEDRPKQFLRLLGEESLLQASYRRAALLTDPDKILVLTSDQFVARVRADLPELPRANVIGEPCRRDTAAAVALGAAVLHERHERAMMVVLTADHRIEPEAVFRSDMLAAIDAAREEGFLYTLGIRPTHPATGYGYLELGEEVAVPAISTDRGPVTSDLEERAPGTSRHYRVVRFREKPDSETARRYVESGRFLWNSGMFVWSTDTIMQELKRQLPSHVASLAPAVRGGVVDDERLREAFADLQSVSIDYGVMEGARQVRTIEASFSWDDLGGWQSLAEFLPDDGEGNRYRGRLVARDARSNVVFSEQSDELVALLGVDNVVVVRAGPRTLVARRDRSEEVKQLVRELEADGEDDAS